MGILQFVVVANPELRLVYEIGYVIVPEAEVADAVLYPHCLVPQSNPLRVIATTRVSCGILWPVYR